MDFDTIIVGAGVLGASTAYHLKRLDPDRNVLLVEKEKRPGAGNTSRSAALYRNIFSSVASKKLATSSIKYYLELGSEVQMDPIGYLWMFSERQWKGSKRAVSTLDNEIDEVEILGPADISSLLNINTEGKGPFPEVGYGIFGHLCGSLSGMGLAQHYAGRFLELGGVIRNSTEIDGLILKGASSSFSPWDEAGLKSISTRDGKEIKAKDFIFTMGAWSQDLLGRYGIFTGTLPKKRQLFGIKVEDPYQIAGDVDLDKVPALILPAGGTYVKPILHRNMMILGLADDLGQPYSIEGPYHDEEHFNRGIVPVIEHYFPDLKDWELKMKWAGHYSYHWPDKNPVIESVQNITWAAGTSGSGIMKADAVGRITASKVLKIKTADLFNGSKMHVSDLSLKDRNVENESFVI